MLAPVPGEAAVVAVDHREGRARAHRDDDAGAAQYAIAGNLVTHASIWKPLDSYAGPGREIFVSAGVLERGHDAKIEPVFGSTPSPSTLRCLLEQHGADTKRTHQRRHA
jgi:hypothetical protein